MTPLLSAESQRDYFLKWEVVMTQVEEGLLMDQVLHSWQDATIFAAGTDLCLLPAA